MNPYRALEATLDYRFSNQELLKQALTHRSKGRLNNERLEFLGDAILNMTIAQALFERFPTAKEGQMSRLRASLVKGETLAELGRDFALSELLIMGPGELKSGGFRRDSILADAVEAIIGAISLDADLAQAQQSILHWYQPRLASLSLEDVKKDPKTLLQEYLQGRSLALPDYQVVHISGQDHDQIFTVFCQVDALSLSSESKAKARKIAEQQCAQKILTQIKSSNCA